MAPASQALMLPKSTIAVVIRAKEPKKPRAAALKEGAGAVFVMGVILPVCSCYQAQC